MGQPVKQMTNYHRVHILIIILMTGTLANSVDPDEMLY